MVKSIEMKRVEVTLFTFVNPPIDWVLVGVILRNSRRGSIEPIPLHAMIIKASALSTVVPDGRDLGIFTHIGGVLDNKEFAHSVPANDAFSVSFLVRKGRI
jgi:hypothetical protein